jgi:F-type H+-transporting ATPase subunit epsilon
MPENKLILTIVTPERQILSEPVDEVVLPSVEGYLGVLAGHAPLLAQLDVGEISYRVGTSKRYLAVSGGFAEIQRTGVDILAETCEPAEDIDLARAENARQRAKTLLEAQVQGEEFKRAEVKLKKALSRIQVAGRKE